MPGRMLAGLFRCRLGSANGREIRVLLGHEDEFISSVFSVNGTRVVTASWGRTARIWDTTLAAMSAEALIADVCTRRLPDLPRLTRVAVDSIGEARDAPLIDPCEGWVASPVVSR